MEDPMSIARRYALALVAARRAENSAWHYRRRAWELYEDASLADKKRLDTIKRIMEIDTTTTSFAQVMERAEEYDAG
jgi:hypothetical protein